MNCEDLVVKIADFNCAEECQEPDFLIYDAQGGAFGKSAVGEVGGDVFLFF